MRRYTLSLAATLVSIIMVGCATGRDFSDGNFVRVGYHIADTLIANNAILPLGQQDPVIVASFVNVNNLQQSSSFGRMISEQVGSRLAQRGKHVIEMKLRQTSVFVSEGNRGEFLLSRDVREISKNHNAAVVVVGTYADVAGRLYISARMLNPTDSTIISTSDVVVPMYRDELNALVNTN